ncbi:MAG: peptidoglycan-binding protein, partial [Deltaproteobacteria bacterium]
MYERFFGLGDAPFRLTPDPRYLFLSSKHAEALAHLRLGLKESSGFVCITGDVGTGKTTLLRAFLAELGPEVTAAYIISPALSTLELLQRINREFGLPGTSTSQMELVDTLNAHLLAQHQAGRVSVVVVDEAQAFSMDLLEQLRLLSNLETATEKLLRVVLVGQPQLRTLLLDPAMAQLNQRITLRWHMGPLRYRETVAYVRHRLAVASDGKAARLFTVPALRLTHSLADGVPRLINMIAHRAMLAAFVSRQPRVTRRSVVRAYREIKAVPLPGTLSVVRRAAWGGAGVAVGVGVVTLGVPLGWFRDIRRPVRMETTPRPAEVVAKTAPVVPPAEAPRVEAAPGAAEPAPAATAAPAAPGATAAPEPAPALPLPSPVAELERRLTALDPQASARAAAEAVLAAWHARPLADDEAHVPDDLERIAWRRGLED